MRGVAVRDQIRRLPCAYFRGFSKVNSSRKSGRGSSGFASAGMAAGWTNTYADRH